MGGCWGAVGGCWRLLEAVGCCWRLLETRRLKTRRLETRRLEVLAEKRASLRLEPLVPIEIDPHNGQWKSGDSGQGQVIGKKSRSLGKFQIIEKIPGH